jgi:hypothetical protein
MPMKPAFVLILVGVCVRPAHVAAHHEAIFGPQSSLIMTADRFVSVQVFGRELGTADEKSRETTGVVSAGVRVSAQYPLTFTAMVPYSWISEPGSRGTSGTEDVVLGLRYRHDLKGLQDTWDREGNFVMGMGAFELNNGTIDHRAWAGPLDAIGAALMSVERGAWSGIGYTMVRRNLEDSTGNKDGDAFFLGGGLAFTPNEDFRTGRLISYQVGWSFEHFARDRAGRQPVANSGSDQVLLHPAIVYSHGHDVLFFGLVTVPVWRDVASAAAQVRYRFGTGVIYAW